MKKKKHSDTMQKHPDQEALSIARKISFMEFSYNFITQILELLLHYQMALVFITSSSFTAATCVVAAIAAATCLLVSYFLAPYLNRTLSEKRLVLLLPTLLFISSVVFFAFFFMPGVFTSWFAALGLPGVNIILLSCIVGAFAEVIKNSIKYPISDVVTNAKWKQIQQDGHEKLQKDTNFLSGKPAKALAASLIIVLSALSVTGVVNLMWVVVPVVVLCFALWFYFANQLSNQATKVRAKKEENPVPTSFLAHIRDKKFQVIVSIGVLCTLGSALLLMLKNTIIVGAAGADALPFLKFLIFPSIIIANMIMNKVEGRYKEKAFFIFLFCVNALFITFAFVFPYAPFIHSLCFSLGFLPGGASIALQCWMFSLFYITIEVWSSAAAERIIKPLQTKAFKDNELKAYLPSMSIIYCISQIIAMGVTFLMAELALPVATMLIIATSISVVCAIGTAYIYQYGLSSGVIPVNDSSSPVSKKALSDLAANNTLSDLSSQQRPSPDTASINRDVVRVRRVAT